MRRLSFLTLILNFSLLAPAVSADTVTNDNDGDGIEDNLDNCPTVYNPSQERLVSALRFFGDACNPDDDLDGIPDAIEDQLDYRDSRGGDGVKMGYEGNVFFHHNGGADSDGDGATDVYEINTGSDPFTADSDFETIDLIDYFPMGNITYTYQHQAANTETLSYLENYQRTIIQLSDTTFEDSATSLFGELKKTYSIGKYALRLVSTEVEEYSAPGLTYIPYKMKEGSVVSFSELEECEYTDCSWHSLLMFDRGTMEFNGTDHEYITLASTDNTGFPLYIYLKDIGLYGTHYMNLVDYEITNRVDVAAIAAALPEPETPVEVEPQPTSESSSSGGGGGAVNLFWMLLTMVSLIYRRKYRSA